MMVQIIILVGLFLNRVQCPFSLLTKAQIRRNDQEGRAVEQPLPGM